MKTNCLLASGLHNQANSYTEFETKWINIRIGAIGSATTKFFPFASNRLVANRAQRKKTNLPHTSGRTKLFDADRSQHPRSPPGACGRCQDASGQIDVIKASRQ
jgi:hypothetical protein